MKKLNWILVLLATVCLAPPSDARGLSVEVWTDQGNDAVYQPGDVIQLKVRANQDAHVLVYEIDSDGYVRVLFPERGRRDFLEGRRTYRLPSAESDAELVVEKATGQGYIVALASLDPFDRLPWYLRPYDSQGEEIGFVGEPDEAEGITSDGRISGDPFVAMERVRRGVVRNAQEVDAFATAYVSYYVHERVRYPRYICNDCHRPGHYSWWDGWDPYYSSCSVVDFRVNWSWGWGPSYWTGFVPYYVYVYRPDCPPRYRRDGGGIWYSSWDGWSRWNQLWGGPLKRYKSSPPTGYVPPARWSNWRQTGSTPPPGFLVSGAGRSSRLGPAGLPIGRNRGADEAVRETRRPGATREPVGEIRGSDPREGGVRSERRPEARPAPVERPADEGVRVDRGRGERPSAPRSNPPRVEKPREEARRDPPKSEAPRDEHPAPPPQRYERPQNEKAPSQEPARKAPPSEERGKRGGR